MPVAISSHQNYTLAAGEDELYLLNPVPNDLSHGTHLNGRGNINSNLIVGNDFNNQIIDIAGQDSLYGGLGDDTISTTGYTTMYGIPVPGTDTIGSLLDGGDGNDNLYAYFGDTVTGGTGSDHLYVGTANISMQPGNAMYLYGGAGDDFYEASVLVNSGPTSNNVVHIQENPGEGVDTIIVDSGTISIDSTQQNLFVGEIENITVRNINMSTGLQATGNILNNAITGGSGVDSLFGMGGNDTLVSNGGNDVIYAYNQALYNTPGNTFASASLLDGGDGNDALYADGTDTLLGGAGNDRLEAIYGSANQLRGGAGDDVYVIAGNQWIVEQAGEGIDRIESSQTVNMFGALVSGEVENLTLTGSAAVNGNGNLLNNLIIGNSGNNILSGNAGADTLQGGAGADTLYASSANDTLGDYQIDVLDGGLDNDTLYANGYDVLNGGLGNDKLFATLGGNSSLNGGAGDDIYVLSGNQTQWIDEAASAGIDTIRSDSSVDISAAQSWLTGELENIELSSLGASNAIGNALNNRLVGSQGNNILIGQDGQDTLLGMGGDDTLFAGDNPSATADTWGDSLDGGDGNDTLHANGGDTLLGGNGNDTLYAAVGSNNQLDGWSGNDVYVISAGQRVTETNGNGVDLVRSADSVDFSSAQNLLSGELENIELTGLGNINATGNALANRMTGNQGNNILAGGGGNDTLDGGAGNDTLKFGNDAQNGMPSTATGVQMMTGGAGNDLFWFGREVKGGYYSATSSNAITIQDFVSGVDKIRVAADAPGTAPIRMYTETGSTNFNMLLSAACKHGATSSAATLSRFVYNGDTYLVLDRSAGVPGLIMQQFDPNADLMIRLVGAPAVSISRDIVFDLVTP